MNKTLNLDMNHFGTFITSSDLNLDTIDSLNNFCNIINTENIFIFMSVIVVSLGSLILFSNRMGDKIKLFIDFRKFILMKNKVNNTKSFGLPIILNYLGVTIPGDEAEPIINLAFSVFTLSLIGLFCFLSIVGYLLSILIITNKYLEEKINSRPLFKKLVEYYKKSTLIYIGIDIIFCIFIFLFLIFNSLFILGISILK